MKTKSIGPSVVCLLLLHCSSQSQSMFSLRNYEGLVVDAPVYDAQGIPLAGPNFLAELWGAANSNSLTPLVLIDQGFSREIVPFRTRGYFMETSTSPYLCVMDVTPGGYAWLQVRAWDARLGATYETVASLGLGGYGESGLFFAKGGNPFSALDLPGNLIGLQSFSLRPYVPEPSGLSLLVLGGAAWWWSRKQRRRV